MIKLSDIIKSGGGNAKINRFINRYVLSKKEKKDIVNKIKTKGSSSGGSIKYIPKYYRFIEDTPYEYTQMAIYGSTVKVNNNGDISIECPFTIIGDSYIKTLAFSFNPLHTTPDKTKMYIDSFEEFADNGGISEIKQYIERITEEEYYKID